MTTAAYETMSERAPAEFGAFYEEWFAKVYNYAIHRTGSATRADEIVSDTFTRVLGSWKRFDPAKGNRRTWLFSIAFRAVSDHYRSEKRRKWLSLGILSGTKEEKAPIGFDPERAEEQKQLLFALGGLEEKHREIVSLKFFGGMTNRDIAKLTGLSEANVGIILFRSIRRMKKSFPAEGEIHHD